VNTCQQTPAVADIVPTVSNSKFSRLRREPTPPRRDKHPTEKFPLPETLPETDPLPETLPEKKKIVSPDYPVIPTSHEIITDALFSNNPSFDCLTAPSITPDTASLTSDSEDSRPNTPSSVNVLCIGSHTDNNPPVEHPIYTSTTDDDSPSPNEPYYAGLPADLVIPITILLGLILSTVMTPVSLGIGIAAVTFWTYFICTPLNDVHLSFGDFTLLRRIGIETKYREKMKDFQDKRQKLSVIETKLLATSADVLKTLTPTTSVRIGLSRAQTRLYIDATTAGLQLDVMLDSGAERSLMSKDLYLAIPNHTKLAKWPHEVVLKDYNGGTIPQFAPPVLITLRIGSKSITHPFFITEDSGVCLAGLDLLEKHRLNLVFQPDGTQVHIGDIKNPLSIVSTRNAPSLPLSDTLIAETSVEINSGETKSITCSVQRISLSKTTSSPFCNDAIVTACKDLKYSPFTVPSGLHSISPTDNIIDATNFGSGTALIPEGYALGDVTYITDGDIFADRISKKIFAGGRFRQATNSEINTVNNDSDFDTLPEDEELSGHYDPDPDLARDQRFASPSIEPMVSALRAKLLISLRLTAS
jgi:hypothetical protein